MYSSLKRDYCLSLCYYFRQVLVQEKLVIIFVGRFMELQRPPLLGAICPAAHVPTCFSLPLPPSLPPLPPLSPSLSFSDSHPLVRFGSGARGVILFYYIRNQLSSNLLLSVLTKA